MWALLLFIGGCYRTSAHKEKSESRSDESEMDQDTSDPYGLPSTEAPTDQETDAPTDRETDAPTDPWTDAPFDTSTEDATDPATDMPTDRSTDEPFDTSTEEATDPTADMSTDQSTDELPYILKVEMEEVDAFEANRRIYLYWFNIEEDYFHIQYDFLDHDPLADMDTDGEDTDGNDADENSRRVGAASPTYMCLNTFPPVENARVGFAVDLARDDGGNKIPMDVSPYRGVALWLARNDEGFNLEICFSDVHTDPAGGECGEETPCHLDWCQMITLEDDWTLYTILFEDLTSAAGADVRRPFDQTQAYTLKLQSETGIFMDYCLDEILFLE